VTTEQLAADVRLNPWLLSLHLLMLRMWSSACVTVPMATSIGAGSNRHS